MTQGQTNPCDDAVVTVILIRLTSLCALAALIGALPVGQSGTALSAEDVRVFEAVLQHTVRPFVVSFSNRMDAPPPPMLVLDVTMTWCPTGGRGSAACLDRARVESAAQSIAAAPELATSFRNRNAGRVTLPDNLAPDLVSIPHDAVQEALRAWHERAFGYIAFSLPGYAGDRALVWVSYMCDGCGRGWLFTLHQDRDAWIVDEVRRTLAN